VLIHVAPSADHKSFTFKVRAHSESLGCVLIGGGKESKQCALCACV
jgi:hypothetical protein